MADVKQVAAANEAAAQLTTQEAIDLLVRYYEYNLRSGLSGRPLEFLGSPGIGKTAAAKAAAKILAERIPGFQLIIIAPSTTPADELGGIPMFDVRVETGETILHYALPYWLITEHMQPDWKGFIVLDDARQCQGDQQKVLGNFIYERTMRGKRIPNGVQFVLTGNRMEDRAGVVKELTHYSGRKTTLFQLPDLDTWTLWAVENGIRDEVIGFVNFRRDFFSAFDANREKNPNPRTWEAVSRHMDFVTGSGMGTDSKTALGMYAGEVGPGAATEFFAFAELFGNMPDLDNIIKNPGSADIPARPDLRYAVTMALAGRVEAKNFKSILEYAGRISVEHAALVVTISCTRNRSLTTSAAFSEWVQKNKNIIIGSPR